MFLAKTNGGWTAWSGGQRQPLLFGQLPGLEHSPMGCISAKLLAGYPADTLMADLSAEESQAALDHSQQFWQGFERRFPQAQKIGRAGVQQLFLQRPGHWQPSPVGYTLQVESSAADVLLNTLPWPISFIRLPWQAALLQVQWSWPSGPFVRPER